MRNKLIVGSIALLGLVGCSSPEVAKSPEPSPSVAVASPSPSVAASSPSESVRSMFLDVPEKFKITPEKPLVLAIRLEAGKMTVLKIPKGVLYTLKDPNGEVVSNYEKTKVTDYQGNAVFVPTVTGEYRMEAIVSAEKTVEIVFEGA